MSSDRRLGRSVRKGRRVGGGKGRPEATVDDPAGHSLGEGGTTRRESGGSVLGRGLVGVVGVGVLEGSRSRRVRRGDG